MYYFYRQQIFRKGKKGISSKQYKQNVRQRKCRANALLASMESSCDALLTPSELTGVECVSPTSTLLTPHKSSTISTSRSPCTSELGSRWFSTEASTCRKRLPSETSESHSTSQLSSRSSSTESSTRRKRLPSESSDSHSTSSTQLSSRSSSTRASTARKYLPKSARLKCQTILRLFMFAFIDKETKDIMMSELTSNEKVRKRLNELTNCISDDQEQVKKHIQKEMRQIHALRSKGSKKAPLLNDKIKKLKSKYSIRKIGSITGMSYRQVYKLVNPHLRKGHSRRVTQEDRLAVYKVVLKTVHSMQIPYRRFAKYFYLRETIAATYKAYVKEQQKLGLRVLSESAMYKNLPSNMRSQKHIPFMECLCMKCLNFAGFIDALISAGVKMERRAVLNVIFSICPFLVNKNEITGTPACIQPSKPHNEKKAIVSFGTTEEIQFEQHTFNFCNKSKKPISNDNVSSPKKHDPDYYLIGSENAPVDITTETVVLNAARNCMFRECTSCGVHEVFHKLVRDNPNLGSELNKPVVWFKWTSFVETIQGEPVQRPFDRYMFDGTLVELLEVYFNAVHTMSNHYFHYKWQAVQYQRFRETIRPGEVGLVMDFGQNINHKKQLEAQSTHFNRRQSTIFPLVCFFPCPLCPELVTHEISCISDDLKHDAFAVRAFELEAIHVLRDSGVQVNHLLEWCDNCSIEFKSKQPFFLLSCMDIRITRNYWGENHGKGPADAVIGRVSQFLRSAIARGKTSINHGLDMALYLQSMKGTPKHHPGETKCQHYRQSFVYVDTINRSDFNPTVQRVNGTRSFHCVANTGCHGVLKVRQSSCVCRSILPF